MTIQIRYAALTDKGLQRRRNEDAYVTKKRSRKGWFCDTEILLLAIADGLGGHACGEIASSMACDELGVSLDEISERKIKNLAHHLKRKFHYINHLLRTFILTDRDCHNMATTLSAIVLWKNRGVIAHVGDCRIYRYRRENLQSLTRDHSLVQEMVEEGLLSVKAAERHPYRNRLRHVIGTSDQLERVDIKTITLFAGDRYLLSTDGLHGEVGDDEIKKILATTATPQRAAEHLLALALQRGGSDNITGIAVFLD